ncbi:hemolysin D [Psychrosphaera saromensis]|uniref:Efflux transporter periplasmic adaptor subunit n=1 Tax=Psychrosphaera saromensis TaxID=716813 RepID=A0A2S7UXJ9_9GAMM|nr:efflux RND transporter periplasmic adaptor subunit [Psychrosphaera saromensis]PQJ54499.1 efflux transporter periplasmic adaptor subunit [Psychrosphaera saromensis]GHB59481.1 hemolysin D [Psychrosphaera saromensis]GLQ14300.1 hemolysin D [Psychrosphaera saromensis]
MKQIKQQKSNTVKSIMLGVFVGTLVTAILSYSLFQTADSPMQNMAASSSSSSSKDKGNGNDKAENAEKTPAYWVAPMDANYRRDKPGKSPMGMDLVPVYENTGKSEGQDVGAGAVKISSNVINNLGVRTVQVSYKPLTSEINTLGYITHDEERLVDIHPRVEGWIEKLHVKSVGEQVKKGQALYDIYSPELVNAQEEFLLALERDNNRLIKAAQNRLMALQLPTSAITELRKNKQVQQRITFFAPQNGVVESLNIREGFYVKPGSSLMSIADLSEVWLEGEVFERQAGQVAIGMPATITLDYLPGKVWQGNVDYIHPILNPQTRTVKVRIRIKNHNNDFKPNMFAQLVLHNQGDVNTLQIPKEALIRTGRQDRVVLALGQGRFKSIAVKVGRYGGDYVEILNGLEQGDEVVSSAQFLLDSESSKSSDFKRMDPVNMNSDTTVMASSMQDHNMEIETEMPSVLSATATGKVNSLMVEHGMINISRSAIKKWGRAAATVDFTAAENVSFVGININDKVEFTFEVHDGNFVITEIATLATESASDDDSVEGSVSSNHSNDSIHSSN